MPPLRCRRKLKLRGLCTVGAIPTPPAKVVAVAVPLCAIIRYDEEGASVEEGNHFNLVQEACRHLRFVVSHTPSKLQLRFALLGPLHRIGRMRHPPPRSTCPPKLKMGASAVSRAVRLRLLQLLPKLKLVVRHSPAAALRLLHAHATPLQHPQRRRKL